MSLHSDVGTMEGVEIRVEAIQEHKPIIHQIYSYGVPLIVFRSIRQVDKILLT